MRHNAKLPSLSGDVHQPITTTFRGRPTLTTDESRSSYPGGLLGASLSLQQLLWLESHPHTPPGRRSHHHHPQAASATLVRLGYVRLG